jgi:hypothetical protein
LVLSSEANDSGVRRSCTNIHFSVFCFNNAEGEPLLCTIIHKSMKDISQLSSNLKLGIDRTIDITNEGTRLEVINANL